MFLVASNVQQVKPLMEKPWACIGAGLVLLAIGLPLVGASPLLLAAGAIPLLELRLCFGKGRRLPQRFWLLAAVLTLVVHAMLLAMLQVGTKGVEKLSVNLEYLGAVLAGTGAGALLFRDALQRHAARAAR